MKQVLIIGDGVWSKTLQRVLSDMYTSFVVAKRDWPEKIEGCTHVILATPAPTHFGILKELVPYRLPILVEKPAVLTTKDAKSLEKLVAKHGTPITCHTPYLYTGFIQRLKDDVADFDGYFDYTSQRCNPQGGHADGNSFTTHGPHDLYILWYLGARRKPEISVSTSKNQITVDLRLGASSARITTGEFMPFKERYISVDCSDYGNDAKFQVVGDSHYITPEGLDASVRNEQEPLRASLTDFIYRGSKQATAFLGNSLKFISWSAAILESVQQTLSRKLPGS